jgi:urocanate hydratase
MKHSDIKQDKPMMKKVAKAEVKSHEKKMHGMKKGGVTSMDMKKYGRNMARAMNQRGASRGK